MRGSDAKRSKRLRRCEGCRQQRDSTFPSLIHRAPRVLQEEGLY